MKIRTMVPVLALAAAPAFSQAQVDLQPAERAPYFGGSVGMNDDEETTWRLFGGYRAHRNLAVELGYADLGDMNIGGHGVNSEAWDLVAVGILPIVEGLAVIGKLGAYRGEARGSGMSERRTDLTWGLGAQYDMTRNLGVRLEWQRYTDFGRGAFGPGGDQDVLSLGAIYRFR